MKRDQLNKIIENHKKWIDGNTDGERADLQGADLHCAYLQDADLLGADLRGADLRGADLRGAYLNYADLRGADLRGADLRGADLRDTDLQGADLQGADLQGAYLNYADLLGADLRGADLRGAYLQGAKNIPYMSWTSIVPEEGSFIGWKKVREYIVKLKILDDAKRSNATGRKCRCSAAEVLEIQNMDGTKASTSTVYNDNYKGTVYTVGVIVRPDSFDDDRWNECSHGIHFFITRQEAVDY